jgi:hypoxia up-regulated 1
LNEFVEDERGLVAFQTFSLNSKEESTIYYTEEILAMILKYGRELSEKSAGGATVRDAVITIPSYFTQEQRRMMLDAADLAGLTVISLTHENVAAATMFAVDRLEEEPINVLFYNMGGVDTEVTIARFSAITDSNGKAHESVEILAETYDKTLGGQEFDKVIVDMLAEAFDQMPERAGKPSVRTNDRAMKRLFKESIKVKDILSANKVADVKVPELVDYVTLRTLLQRSDFEERSSHLLARVGKPIQDALALAELSLEDITQVEILGGGLRVPRVHEIIKQEVQQTLNVHLNGDEAMCFGASYIAANSTSSFKVKKVYLTQHPQFDYRVEIRPLDDTDIPEDSEITYNKDFVLVGRGDYLGAKKTIALSYDRDLEVRVFAA